MGAEPALIGRRNEIEAIERAFDRVASGRAAILVITGEPGIGKTRLIEEICRRADERRWAVLRGQAIEFERETPYGVLADALDPFFAEAGPQALATVPDGALDSLADVVPALARPPAPNPLPARQALREVLDALGAAGPAALILDDLHWADEGSVQVVRHLLRRPPRGPQLIALAYRPAAAPGELHRAIVQAGGIEHLEPGQLTRAEALELLGPDVDPGVGDTWWRLSGGNPFYLTELARARPGQPGRRGGDLRIGDVVVPRAVRYAIAEELDDLSERARLFVQGAAVGWDPFDPDLAAHVAGLDPSDALPALDEAVGRGVVKPLHQPVAFASITGPRHFRFRHSIVRHAVYTWASEGWRIGAHARAAEVFGRRAAPVPLLAHHVERSALHGDLAAAMLLERAARAETARAPRTAARWYAAALRLLPAADAERRAGALAPLALVLAGLGRTADCQAVLQELLECAPRQESVGRLRSVAVVARLEPLVGGPDPRAAIDDALRATGEAVELRLARGVRRWLAGDEAGMLADATAARPVADGALAVLAETLLALGSEDDRQLASAAQLADSLPDEALAQRVEVLALLGHAEAERDRPQAALCHAERGVALARSAGQEALVLAFAPVQAAALVRLGRVADAEACVEAARGLVVGSDRAALVGSALECVIASCRGNVPTVLASARATAAALAGEPPAAWTNRVRAWLGAVLIDAGQPAEGRDLILAATALAGDTRAEACAALVDAELALGRLAEARRWSETAAARHPAADSAPDSAGRSDPAGARHPAAVSARAAVLLAGGNPGGAALGAAEAARGYRERGDVLAASRADVLAGRALAAAGEAAGALGRLEAAHAAFASYGAERQRKHAARELRALGRRVFSASPRSAGDGDGVAALTAREREVADLVALGHTNRRIAEQLFVSRKTVETHLHHIFEKLGARSRVDVTRVMLDASHRT